jgi:EAL domain-containing protein (putative c-di-GMP-specific phosphodiesterase class I)
MGCDTVQGFVFAPAMLEDDFLSWAAASSGQRSRSVA